jgi:zinc protease
MSIVAVAVAVACGDAVPKFAIKHAEQRGQLDHNGLRFVILPDPSASLVEVAVRYDVGARDDPPGKAGLAHLVEHLRFDLHPGGGPKTVTYYLDRLSTRWNAYTSYDVTHYMALGSSRQLESLIQLEASRLADRCQTISEQEFLREREVVRNEIRQRGGTPEGQIEPLLVSTLYPRGHPYARMVGGDDQQIASLTRDDACAFIDRYYAPDHATVILAGQLETQPAIRMIERWFNPLDRRAAVPRAPVAPATLASGRASYDLDIERPIVALSWALPPARTVADTAVVAELEQRLARVLDAARIYGFATRASVLDLGGRDAPSLSLIIELTALDQLEPALRFAWKAAKRDKTARDRETWAEPTETKNRLKAAFLIGLEPLEARADVLADLVQFTPGVGFLSSDVYVFHHLEDLDRLDLEDVQTRVDRIVDPERAQVTVFRPNRTGIAGDRQAAFTFEAAEHDLGDAEVDPAEANGRIDVSSYRDATATASRLELENGLHVVLLPRGSSAIPVVTAELVVGAGDAAAPDSPLLAGAVARFARPPDEVLRKMWRGGVGVGCVTTPDHTRCLTRAINLYLPEMIEGLSRRFRAGEYDEEWIERWQTEAGDLARRRRKLARDEFERRDLIASFGPDHPYTRAGVWPPGAERGIRRDELIAFRNAHYGAVNTTLVVAGAFDPQRVTAMIHETFDGWPRGQADPVVSAPAVKAPGFIGVIRDPGPQMEIVIAYPAPGGLSGQDAVRRVVVEMLRDSAEHARSELGATYGAQVRRDARRGPSRYELRAAVDATRAGQALKQLRDGVAELRAPTDSARFDAVFARARRKVVQRLIDENSASRDLAERLATIAEFDLPADYYNTLVHQVAALSRAQVKAVLATDLAAAGESVVLTADRATLTAAFAAAGIDHPQLVEPAYDP